MTAVRLTSLLWLTFLVSSTGVLAQSDTLPGAHEGWWKGLFRSKTVEQAAERHPATPVDSQNPMASPEDESGSGSATTTTWESLDTAGSVVRVQAPSAALVVHVDTRLASMDSAWRADPPAMAGYRIQLVTGPLQACRKERSTLREQTELGVYLEPLSLNYQVLIGDFRDLWSAERERTLWVGTHPNALVVPSNIELPLLH